MRILIISPLAINKLHTLQLLYPMFTLGHDYFAALGLADHLKPEAAMAYDDLLEHRRIKELFYTSDETEQIGLFCKQHPHLSVLESTGLYLAQREGAVVFATHRLVRALAKSKGISVCGYSWLFDQWCIHQVFKPMEVFQKWKTLETLFYAATDKTVPDCVSSFYRGSPKRVKS